MFLKLLVAFTVVPTVELYLLFKLAEILGAFETVAIVLITGAVGAALAKREGFAVLKKLAEESQAGFPSGDRIIEGVMVLIGGCLLLTPGVLTDLTGFALIFPLTRGAMIPLLKSWAMSRVQVASMGPEGVVFEGGGISGSVGAPRRPNEVSGIKGHFDHPIT